MTSIARVCPPSRRLICGYLAAAAAQLVLAAPWPAVGAEAEMADRILVLKADRRLLLLRGGLTLASFPIALGERPVGPKRAEGDGRTPEGVYWIDGRNPRSRFHLALHISYPNAADRAQARTAGAAPGGDIAIHGMPRGYGPFDPIVFYRDWTNGCIAVGNRAIETIWDRVTIGTPVEIRP